VKVVAPFEPAIRVMDLEQSLLFYRDTLGMTVFSFDDVPASQSDKVGLSPHGYRIARLETDRGDRLKLVEPVGLSAGRQPTGQHILERRGFVYLTFIVPHIGDILIRLRQAETKIRTGSEAIMFRAGTYVVFAEDPDGNVLEFVERDDLDRYRPDGTATKGSHSAVAKTAS